MTPFLRQVYTEGALLTGRLVLAAAAIGLLSAATQGWARGGGEQEYSFKMRNGQSVRIVEAPFDSRKHNVKGCAGRLDGCRIDGHIPFGVDNRLPATYVKRIEVSYGGRRYNLEVSNMYDAWNGRPYEAKGPNGSTRYFGGSCSAPAYCTFRGLFSDASGAFVAEWIVVDGISTRTVLTSSSDVMYLFIANIDLPQSE